MQFLRGVFLIKAYLHDYIHLSCSCIHEYSILKNPWLQLIAKSKLLFGFWAVKLRSKIVNDCARTFITYIEADML